MYDGPANIDFSRLLLYGMANLKTPNLVLKYDQFHYIRHCDTVTPMWFNVFALYNFPLISAHPQLPTSNCNSLLIPSSHSRRHFELHSVKCCLLYFTVLLCLVKTAPFPAAHTAVSDVSLIVCMFEQINAFAWAFIVDVAFGGCETGCCKLTTWRSTQFACYSCCSLFLSFRMCSFLQAPQPNRCVATEQGPQMHAQK